MREQLVEDADAVEQVGEPGAATAADAGDAVAAARCARPQRGAEADRHRDGPRPQERGQHVRSLHEEDDRDDAGRGSQQRPLEDPQAEHAHARAALVLVERVQRLLVDPESSGNVERAEARCHDAGRKREAERYVAVHARHRSVGDRVRGIGEQLRTRDQRDPPGLDLVERPPNGVGSGHVRDQQRPGGRDRGGQRRYRDRVPPQPTPHARDVTAGWFTGSPVRAAAMSSRPRSGLIPGDVRTKREDR
jgi:hypothetical protein